MEVIVDYPIALPRTNMIVMVIGVLVPSRHKGLYCVSEGMDYGKRVIMKQGIVLEPILPSFCPESLDRFEFEMAEQLGPGRSFWIVSVP